jgi:O-antigen/teichoic acid export membrane protein
VACASDWNHSAYCPRADPRCSEYRSYCSSSLFSIFTPTNKLTAEENGNIELQKKVLATGFWFALCSSSFIVLIAFIALKTTSIIADPVAGNLLSVMLLFVPLTVLTQIIISFLAGRRKMRLIAKINVFLPVAGFVSAISFCYFWGLRGWLVNSALLIIIGFLAYLFFTDIRIQFGWDTRLLSRMLRIGLFAMLGQSVGTILLQFDTLCISGIMKDAEVTGVYNTAAMASQQLMAVVGGILYTVFPYVAKNHNNLPKLRARYKELSVKLFLLSVAAGLCAYLASPWFFPLFGPKFVASIDPFRVLIIGFLCRVQYVLANTYLDALGRTDITFASGLMATICNIVLNIFFIPIWGIMGAAWATVISLIFSMIIREAALHYFIFYKRAVR